MKKWIAIVLTILMMMGITACSNNGRMSNGILSAIDAPKGWESCQENKLIYAYKNEELPGGDATLTIRIYNVPSSEKMYNSKIEFCKAKEIAYTEGKLSCGDYTFMTIQTERGVTYLYATANDQKSTIFVIAEDGIDLNEQSAQKILASIQVSEL